MKTHWQISAVVLGMTFALLVTAIPSLAQFDTLTDNERCELGQLEYCRIRNAVNSTTKKVTNQSDSGQRDYVQTCPYLPPSVVVFGYGRETQCQVVDQEGVGRMDLIERGIINAVDIWNSVTSPVEVCFRSAGTLVFLDATYILRRLTDLDSYERDGMTCGQIDRIGTVVLLTPAPSTEPSATAPSAVISPGGIPLSDCRIKLTETLHLRATPGGAIIGLAWQNTEVTVYAIDGHWYLIDFKGQSGYISRYHREVLRGGCG